MNGERIEEVRTLRLGDVVRMGQTELQVTDGEGRVPEPTRLGAPAPAPPAPAPRELVVALGAEPGRRLTLSDELVIGRAESGEGSLGEDPELSRRHARLYRDAGGRLTIEDLGSANGTFVNGVRVSEPTALELGDSVRVGLTTLELPSRAGRRHRPPRRRAAAARRAIGSATCRGIASAAPRRPPPPPPRRRRPPPHRRRPRLGRQRPRLRRLPGPLRRPHRRRPPTPSARGRCSPGAASRT